MKNLRGEVVEIQAGFLMQWNESNHCITMIDNAGKKVFWKTSNDKRIVSYIKTEGQFEDLVMIIAEITNLSARKVNSDHLVTFKFE